MMHPNIPILPSRRITPPLRVHSNRIQRSKMPLDPTNLILENLVIESRLEFPLPRTCSRYIGCGLATTDNYEIFFGRDGGGVQGGVCNVGF